ncbi:MAG: L-aspartate oxidase [Opitutae bacterium]|nr:L-aspartate oxidase [Opitutae bacterium]|tara:strand:+ start:796 stop:2412 length:1617 start_codon:yes stop_codon:yes gene_type:complete
MSAKRKKEYDFVIVGSGIAGLSFALKVAQEGHRVAIFTKKDKAESNTNYAQGGIAAVTSAGDDLDKHVRDTLEAGDGLCDPKVVEEILRDGPDRIRDLIDLGVAFSSLEDGSLSLGKEGGHSERRVLHVKDLTGKAIEDALLASIAKEGVDLFEHFFAIDLITANKARKLGVRIKGKEDHVLGLYLYDANNERVVTVSAPAILLATGGAGQTYLYTTNPSIATGDGIAMASRSGLSVTNLEFIQFHPTAFHSLEGDRFLITEAVRGEGAKLIDSKGRPFLKKYHPLADLAPRDVVARAIDREMKRSGSPFVRLDTPNMKVDFPKRFPNVYENCLNRGVNPVETPIPVVPAAHYTCGGIPTKLNCSTQLDGLYACGEVACTGLHGANRLASNSLLEAVVMAHRGAEAVCEFLDNRQKERIQLPEWVDGDVPASDERVVLSHNLDELKRTMWDYVGIVRSTRRLERAQSRIKNLGREINEYYWNARVDLSLLEVRNLVCVADLIIRSALRRKESRGLHYTLDYPDLVETPENTVVRSVKR